MNVLSLRKLHEASSRCHEVFTNPLFYKHKALRRFQCCQDAVKAFFSIQLESVFLFLYKTGYFCFCKGASAPLQNTLLFIYFAADFPAALSPIDLMTCSLFLHPRLGRSVRSQPIRL